MARDIGWVVARAIGAARATIVSSPAVARTDWRPSVSVPVLSNHTVPVTVRRSSVSPPLIRIPRRAACPMAAATASGVASASAHGHDTTSSATACSSAMAGSSTDHTASVITDKTNTAVTTYGARRSAASTTGARRVAASSTMAASLATRVSRPEVVVMSSMGPLRLMAPAVTSSPARTRTGRDSPVSSEASMVDSPTTTRPSMGTWSPARTAMRAPTPTSSVATSRSTPSTSSRAVEGARACSSSAASPARRCAFTCSQRPACSRNTRAVRESK